MVFHRHIDFYYYLSLLSLLEMNIQKKNRSNSTGIFRLLFFSSSSKNVYYFLLDLKMERQIIKRKKQIQTHDKIKFDILLLFSYNLPFKDKRFTTWFVNNITHTHSIFKKIF